MSEKKHETQAEKQKAYRARQEEKQMEFNRQATALRSICHAVQGLMALGVEEVTLRLPAINHISDLALRGREIENQLVMAQVEAQESKKAAAKEGEKVRGRRPRSNSAKTGGPPSERVKRQSATKAVLVQHLAAQGVEV